MTKEGEGMAKVGAEGMTKEDAGMTKEDGGFYKRGEGKTEVSVTTKEV